jgi:hypothetical protein
VGAQLTDAELESLRRLPLFEREDGAFVALTVRALHLIRVLTAVLVAAPVY